MNKNSTKILLLIYPHFSTFVQSDFEILKKRYFVKRFHYKTGKKLFIHFLSQIRLFFFLIFNLPIADIIYIWFADYHSFLPVFFSRLLQKKSIIILGGYDVTYIPELKYGSFSNFLRTCLTSYSLKHAKFLLAVDKSLINEMYRWIKKVYGQVKVLPTGYDPDKWYCNHEKEKIVLTVCACNNMIMLKRKGIDFLINVAYHLQEYSFTVVGLGIHIQKQLKIPENVVLCGQVEQNQLREYYSRAKVYAQFSLWEGLPNVLCEAMLCECVPVGTRIAGIPTAINDCGFLIDNHNIDQAIHSIKEAMQTPASLGNKARQRIKENFKLNKREKQLIDILNG